MSSPCDAGPWRSGNGAQAALEQQAPLRHTEVASGAELRGEGEEAEEGAEPPLQWKHHLLEDRVYCSQRPTATDTQEYKRPTGLTQRGSSRVSRQVTGLQAGTRRLHGDLVLLPTAMAMLLLCMSPAPATETAGVPADCSHLHKTSPSGVYVIQPAGSPPRVVWCDMDTEGKGWTVVQRNSHDTEITWKQSWTTYKYGFGNVQGDHWLGTEYLHLLTQQGTYKVRFIVRNKANVTHYAEYDIFSVESEASGYPLRLGRFLGSGEDYLTSYHSGYGGIHDNMKFSTTDRDQDQHTGNCANSYGGWWYDKCQNVLLNGKKYIFWPGICQAVTAHPPSSWSNPQMCADRLWMQYCFQWLVPTTVH
ncbi:PREDICTED: LOW QUALITY PROTEIN: microfibril-associated glycoprotein 4-like [Pygoscelis adeliae]|uniref:LOW QUALITY PROTEIN: microfibril-associated glycoprotein 4-like n=1 Tax=Pygoscelis adeliae TaxID=9238 RepID=UPI0004F4E326|nr:PREDICTED: LOW QUALITY PROTEIN: microfibril-associated glycoprotein 4-like [Pygoscelis adeliae]